MYYTYIQYINKETLNNSNSYIKINYYINGKRYKGY